MVRQVFRKICHLCIAAHSRPCTATSPQARLACLRHVLRHCTALFLAQVCMAQVCKHRVASTCPLLTVLAGAISSLSIEAVEDCLIELSPIQWLSPTGKTQLDLSSVSVTAGRISGESQAPLKISGQKPPVRAPSSSLTSW